MLVTLYIIVMMVLFFGATIFVHEFGHFIVARLCGLKVDAFSIGMGPALWKKRVGETVYKIGALPIGGYVALPQLDPTGMSRLQGANGESRQLPEVSPWKKIAVAAAGPFFNILFALLLAAFVAAAGNPEDIALVGTVKPGSEGAKAGLHPGDRIVAVNGHPVKSWYDVRVEAFLDGEKGKEVELTVLSPDGARRTVRVKFNDPAESEHLIDGVAEAVPCVLGHVYPGTPAEAAGVKPGDVVRRFAGVPVNNWRHFVQLVREHPDEEVEMVVERDGREITLHVKPEYREDLGFAIIGVAPGGISSMPWTLSGNPFEQVKSDADSIFRLLKALVTPKEAKQAAGGLGGPVAIFTMLWYALQLGLVNTLGLIRFLNVNLAILNLLPLPVLDGGHICFALWEGITRRKINPRIVEALTNAFAILLIAAMIFLSLRDVDRTWNLSRFFHFGDKPPATAPAE